MGRYEAEMLARPARDTDSLTRRVEVIEAFVEIAREKLSALLGFDFEESAPPPLPKIDLKHRVLSALCVYDCAGATEDGLHKTFGEECPRFDKGDPMGFVCPLLRTLISLEAEQLVERTGEHQFRVTPSGRARLEGVTS